MTARFVGTLAALALMTDGLPALPAGTQIAMKAVNASGLEGWDWARTIGQ